MTAGPHSATESRAQSARDARRFDKVSIRGLRGLENLELDGLGAFNLFVGANDTGKTSVLEAVFLLSNLSNWQLIVRIQNHRGLLVRGFDDLLNMIHGLNVDGRADIAATAEALSEERKLSISTSYSETPAGMLEQRAKNGGGKLKRRRDGGSEEILSSSVIGARVMQYDAELKDLSLDKPLHFPYRIAIGDDGNIDMKTILDSSEQTAVGQKMRINARIMSPGPGYNSDAIGRLIVEKKDADLVNILKRIDPQVQGIRAYKDMVYLDTGFDKMLPINVFGGGMIRAANISAYCIVDSSEIILIDEIENGIHHEAMRPLMESILRISSLRGIQVFATTHSIDVLKTLRSILSEEKFEKFRPTTVCYVLARNWKGVVRPYRYDHDQFDHCIKHEIEIR